MKQDTYFVDVLRKDMKTYTHDDGTIHINATARKIGSNKDANPMMQFTVYAIHPKSGRMLPLLRHREPSRELQREQKPRLQMFVDLLRAAYPQHTFKSANGAFK